MAWLWAWLSARRAGTARRWRKAVPLLLCAVYLGSVSAANEAALTHREAALRYDGVSVATQTPLALAFGMPHGAARTPLGMPGLGADANAAACPSAPSPAQARFDGADRTARSDCESDPIPFADFDVGIY